MSDRRALLNAILDAPDDDAPRLVYADWLREVGEYDRAEFIAVQIRLHRLIHDEGEIGFLESHIESCRRRERELLQPNARDWFLIPVLSACSVWDHSPTIRWYPAGDCRGEDYVIGGDAVRGFIETLTVPAAAWLAHADAILAEHPVQSVRLTTVPEAGECLHGHVSDGRLVLPLAGQDVAIPNEGPRVYRGRDRDWWLRVLTARWPGVTFELPPAPQGGFLVPQHLVPTIEELIRSRFAERMQQRMDELLAEEENLIMNGDPTAPLPGGVINAYE